MKMYFFKNDLKPTSVQRTSRCQRVIGGECSALSRNSGTGSSRARMFENYWSSADSILVTASLASQCTQSLDACQCKLLLLGHIVRFGTRKTQSKPLLLFSLPLLPLLTAVLTEIKSMITLFQQEQVYPDYKLNKLKRHS